MKCKNGHEKTPENTNKRGYCKTCASIAHRKYMGQTKRPPKMSEEERRKRAREAYHRKKKDEKEAQERVMAFMKKEKIVAMCRNGHELTPENLWKGRCKQCKRDCNKRARQKKAEARRKEQDALKTEEQRKAEAEKAHVRALEKQRLEEYREKVRLAKEEREQKEQHQIAEIIKDQQLKTRSGKIIQPPNEFEDSLFTEKPIVERKPRPVLKKKKLNAEAMKETLAEFNKLMIEKGFLREGNFRTGGEHLTFVECENYKLSDD